ncbi:MAG TPA: proprotein convertase P-domain-containing protein [Chthoniobacterales bacterium]|nr:proprotein convertase P-domain-containing protein [Chthoniobacterales bacterium]
MKMKTTNERETRLEQGLKAAASRASYRKWQTLATVLLCLMGLSATVRSARADTNDIFTGTNGNPITTPDSGQASLYPSTIVTSGIAGKVIGVRVQLNNISHSFPGDYDILLVGPGGQSALLMSDCGGDPDLNNVSLLFSETGPALPISSQITTGSYRPTNYGGTGDTFPPNATQFYSASFSVFNNTSPNGAWSLYVVDDATQDSGTIAGGWTLELTLSEFFQFGNIILPDSGNANPYPSQINVSGLQGSVRKARVTLSLSHSFPDDVDILLVGPAGQNAIIMSDVGAGTDVTTLNLTFDDDAASALPDNGPLVDGTFRPTNFEPGDPFSGAPAPTGTSVLSVFDGTNPNGTWSLYVVDDAGQDMGQISEWSVAFDMEPSTLANISTRLRVETGDNILIGGFIITGTQPKDVIVRAIGPSLPVAGAIADPTLELRDGQGGLIWFNDDWQTGTGFPSQEAAIIATGVAPTHIREAAIVATLAANNAGYTAVVRGFNNQTGIGVVEAYDLNRTADSKLANISTRGLVQTGDNVLIAGTIITGGPSQRVLVRAIGPSLPVPGPLADPTLELRDGQGTLIAFNDDWDDDQEADVIATTIPPTNNLESAIVATLPANGAFYTAIVRDLNGTTGIAVVEVYGLN